MQFVKSAPGEDPIVVEGYFAATPDEVFEAWTTPEIIVQWFGLERDSLHSADIDLRPGGQWRFLHSKDAEKSTGFEGRYIDVKPQEKLIYTWAYVVEHRNGEREVSPDSQVEVDFIPQGKGTIVRLVHSMVRTEDARRGIGGGWQASFTSLGEVLTERAHN
ncbi:MAG: SRPBCC domain-containing protein [Rhizobiaceae bacterium]|nr:SRPBCC domain-containing protein [Rhizobiaceae bacterium]